MILAMGACPPLCLGFGLRKGSREAFIGARGDDRPLRLRISVSGMLMLKSSFFLSSILAAV